MKNIRILWADDEIDLLKIQILFLQEKGYEVVTATNGDDAIELVGEQDFDIIFLDENMPGLSGLETLNRIKSIRAGVPVVMITKSEEEDIMEQAIGAKIADFLIKPVKPNQILLTIKKNVDQQHLINKQTTAAYQTEFTRLGMQINETHTFEQWAELYKKIVFWEIELDGSSEASMKEVLTMQKEEANSAFAKFIKKNYLPWFGKKAEQRPLMSPSLLKERVLPLLHKGEQVFVFLIDNLRFDQWKEIQPLIQENYLVENEEIFCSILPTATQYARNSIFAGLMPSEIQKLYPQLWLNDEEAGGKNLHEEELLRHQLNRHGIHSKLYFDKVLHAKGGKKILENLSNIVQNQFVVVIYNFIDMLSHARTEIEMIRELAKDEPAYRSLTRSWFRHSTLWQVLRELSNRKCRIFITTDHGSVRVHNALKVIGDKKTSTNLRYKQGRNLNYKAREVFDLTDPAKAYLPSTNISSSYIFATNNDFLAYPNNYNYYVKYYKNTFQHGGVSLEEMLIPMIRLRSKVL